MCFAPRRCALFRHVNFQKWSGTRVRRALRGGLAWPGPNPGHWGALYILTWKCASHHDGYTFSTCQLPKVVRHWGVLYILTSTCASRHNGVHLFISPLARWLRTRRFSEPTFRPSGATNHWKNTVNCDFSTFSRTCIFFLLLFSSLTLPSSAFPSVHIVGSLTSKVPLLNYHMIMVGDLNS